MIADFIPPSDRRWLSFLTTRQHDIYHLPEYIQMAAKHEGGLPVAFYAQEGESVFLAPLLIRKILSIPGAPDDWYDAITPYGYPTPLFYPSTDCFFLTRALQAFREGAAERNIVSAFFRLHPLLPLPPHTLTECGTLVKHGQTVFIDLSVSSKEYESQLRQNHRRDIRKLVSSGFQAKVDEWDMYDEFISLYRVTMERVAASTFYSFSKEYFTDLRLSLGGHLHLCVVMAPHGEVAAAGLFTAVDNLVQYHLGGTAGKYLSQAPSKLMFHFMRGWAKESGYPIFHIGGGVGGLPDSLFRFKAGFSNQISDFYTYRFIVDKEKYEILVQLAGSRLEDCCTDYSGFFPAYRSVPSVER